jgi:hypothetical protein
MNSMSLGLFLQLLLSSLPTMLVCLGASVVILTRWKSGCSWSLWALLGFGLGLIISIAFPLTQACVQSWIVHSGHVSSYAWIFTLLAFIWSLLRAAVYVLLFVAIFEGRKQE